ncbi:hypothetical protein [Streptomyces subrutilus]|uniref:hypothetical protein n=1 Tax=Streptomyces subrutilus TaxID=36818 RepID=UPI00279592F2|nr:hypothetical protein [Streptomyces subrutilus]
MTNPVPPPCSSDSGESNPNRGALVPAVPTTTPRALLGDAQFNGVMHTVLDNNPVTAIGMASRIVVEALKFVVTAATFPSVRIAPAREVDEGWHALILHTHLYAGLCSRLGRTVRHCPERPDRSATTTS